MKVIGFFVELEIDPKRLDIFHKFMTQHSEVTLTEEEGCLAFNVYVDSKNPNHYSLYESYSGQEALNIHRFSKQLAKHRKEVDHMIIKRRIWELGEEKDESDFRGEE